MGAMSALKASLKGLEPSIFGSGNQRLIHLATGTDLRIDPKVRSRGIEPRPPAWKAGILATELRTLKCYKPSTGVEPVTSRLLSECSNQLSYEGRYGESGFRSPCLVVANDALYRLS